MIYANVLETDFILMTECSSFDDLAREMEKSISSIIDRVEAANGKSVAIGIDGSAEYPNGKKVSTVARYIEYGIAGKMKPRPFMRMTISEHGSEWENLLGEKCAKIIQGKGSNYKQALEGVGKIAARDVKNQITAMGAVDTGRLRDSIEARIVDR